MLDTLRKPFLWVALVLLTLALLVELGSCAFLSTEAPGYGVPFLAFLDGLLWFVILSTAVASIPLERIQGRLQALVTLILSILVIVGGILAILAALALLLLMVALFLAVPFGTAVYMAKYGDFPRASAGIALSLLTALKLGYAICMVLAHQSFLKNKSLVLLTLCSFLTDLIVSILHGLVPGPLVSITDTVAAIVVVVVAVIWALLILVSSIRGVKKSIA